MASISGFGLLEFFSCCRLQTVLFSGLSGCGLFSTVVSVAVDCRQFCLNGLSGCGPWVPFVTGLSGSRTSCVIASVAMEQFCSVISVEDLTLLGPLAAAVAVDLWVYFIILCGYLSRGLQFGSHVQHLTAQVVQRSSREQSSLPVSLATE